MKSAVAALLFAAAQAYEYEKLSNFLSMYEVSNGFGEIEIELDGEKKTYYIAAPFSEGAASSEHLKVPANGRGYISETPTLD